MTAVQLDLFGEVLTSETRRVVDGLACLRDAHPRALDLMLGERRPDTGEIKVGASGPWAYSVRRAGFYFEDRGGWGGWYARPAHLLTWSELDALVGGDARLLEVRAWSESLHGVGGRNDRMRPHELWPDPGGWHPSYIEGDHERPGWDERITAWRTVLAILDDAIARESR
ncbi:hypothetical protein [Jiangella muralis]|uniref:hypothetical protein n=1 Tax=Jiangella muralis TaxID=702383 RepID=UPI00069F4B8B|nr:hypothetical protein [Jiangella muralis]